MNKLDEILEQLSKQQPVLDDADALCDSIMDQLPPQPQHKPRRGLWLNMVSSISAAAALLLLVLTVGQSRDFVPVSNDIDYSQTLSAYQPKYDELSNANSLPSAIRQVSEKKLARTTISQLKKQYAL